MSLLAAFCALGASTHYVDTSLDFDGELLSWTLQDVEADDRRELIVALCREQGERELRVYRVTDEGVDLVPRHTIPILADIVAWSCADVRAEAGRELIFLTGSGAWSYSLTHSGYRDNVRALAKSELVYDISDPSSLPYYDYVVPGAERDTVLLPGRSGFSLWGPSEAPDAGQDYARLSQVDVEASTDSAPMSGDRRSRSEREGEGEASFELEQATPFLVDDLERESALLSNARHYRAPALVDVDGNGGLDLVVCGKEDLALYLDQDGRIPSEPTRIEALPESLQGEDVALQLVDLDADGDLDLLAHIKDDQDDLKNGRHQLLLYSNDGARIVSEKPDQVLRFEAAVMVVGVADIDGNGLPDLALRKLELPSFLSAVGGLNFKFSHLVYLGGAQGFERKPVLKEETIFDEESIVDVIANRELTMDCDGDGIADLVELDVRGHVTIRRLHRKKSFFGGVTWSLEAGPWKRFDAGGSIESLAVEDANGDGLGDVFSASTDRLTILISRRAEGGR